MEAEGLDHSLLGQFHGGLRVQVVVAGKQEAGLLKAPQLLPGLIHLLVGVLGQLLTDPAGAGLPHGLLPFQQGEQIITHPVQHMDRTAVHVRHQVLSQGGKGMDHGKQIPFCPPIRGGVFRA